VFHVTNYLPLSAIHSSKKALLTMKSLPGAWLELWQMIISNEKKEDFLRLTNFKLLTHIQGISINNLVF
jgi:hypothetical protein